MQALPFIGQAISVISTITAGNDADRVAGRNAAELNKSADASLRASGAKEELLRQRNQQTLSSQRAALAQNGIDSTSGSALIGTAQNMRDAELDALMLRYEGLMNARDIKTQADMVRWEGKAKKKASRVAAVGQIIGAAGNYMQGAGWGTKGPGFSGQQAPAPVETRTPYYGGR